MKYADQANTEFLSTVDTQFLKKYVMDELKDITGIEKLTEKDIWYAISYSLVKEELLNQLRYLHEDDRSTLSHIGQTKQDYYPEPKPSTYEDDSSTPMECLADARIMQKNGD